MYICCIMQVSREPRFRSYSQSCDSILCCNAKVYSIPVSLVVVFKKENFTDECGCMIAFTFFEKPIPFVAYRRAFNMNERTVKRTESLTAVKS